MNKPKYFATYHGPSYGSYDMEFMDAFGTISDAMQAMRNRQMGYDYPEEYRENGDGTMVLWNSTRRMDFPATTESDYMDLFTAIPNDDGSYSVGEFVCRLTVGPRGGIVVEGA